MRGLTFELSGRRRQDARARAEKMYTVLRTGPWWPAVGAPLERGVRPRVPERRDAGRVRFEALDEPRCQPCGPAAASSKISGFGSEMAGVVPASL